MRRWMHDHPTQGAELLDWAAAHPGSTAPPPFLIQTPPEFDGYRPWRDPAVYALFDWASQNPDAAQVALSFGRVVATRSPTTVFSQASATSSGVARRRRLTASSAGREPGEGTGKAGCRGG